MTYQEFMRMADKVGIFQAAWIAKYYSVSADTIKAYVSAAMAAYKK